MIASPNFPVEVPTMKDVLADAMLRQFAFKWSKAQYSSENIKFYVAVEKLLKAEDDGSKAIGLKKLRDEFIMSSAPSVVNISGSQRKNFLRRMDGCNTDAELAKLLPNIVSEAVSEIMRVMEFDL